MSEAAADLAGGGRRSGRSWAAPGGARDAVIRTLKIVLPLLIGVLAAYLALAPLTRGKEISFLLDKNKVEVAPERLRATSARYQGLDNRGRPFAIQADSAVQATSREQVVDINGMAARILLAEGPATLTAGRGRYDLTEEKVDVIGPILFTAADGYRIRTRDVTVSLDNRTMASDSRVDGEMPLGRFSADRMQADLPDRRVVLEGRARLHIVQGGLR